uniref:Radical SAM core domain-containing protein n=1 Tax=Kalanchoe fedtschenkoi TaxID=63787 RepID=A0A7N0V770_KALFE
MALIQLVCSMPLARAVRPRSLTIYSRNAVSVPSTSASPSRLGAKESRVLLGLSETELQQLALDFGQQSYRGKQLHQLLYKRKVKEIQDFSHLPLAFRNELQDAGWRVGRSPIHQSVTAADGTIKILIKLEDNRLVETVGIPVVDDKGTVRLTACVSSQVGCPLRCAFCATGQGGFSRNLQKHEIVEQVLAIEELFNQRVTNVVFMGMGEPMMNLKSVVGAHQCLNKDIEIGQRMITISTVGVPNTIKKLASHKLQSTLAVRDYFQETGRRVTFEYTLLAGVNDEAAHAVELAELLHEYGRGYHVNLIPYNPIEGSEFRRPYRKAIAAFSAALESRRITTSVRQTRGPDASAACGQLRNQFQKTPLQADTETVQSDSDVAVAC